MVFSSLNFIFLFLPAVLLAYFGIPQRFRPLKNLVLLVFSLVFYLYGEPVGIFVMLASILANYLFARLIAAQGARARRLLVILSAVLNVGLLGVYKYLGFAVDVYKRQVVLCSKEIEIILQTPQL